MCRPCAHLPALWVRAAASAAGPAQPLLSTGSPALWDRAGHQTLLKHRVLAQTLLLSQRLTSKQAWEGASCTHAWMLDPARPQTRDGFREKQILICSRGKQGIAQGTEPAAITEHGGEFEHSDLLQHPPGSATIQSQEGVAC